jgi:hypothetical protein
MGNWRIVIEGTGPHHNNPPDVTPFPNDADKLAVEAAALLKGAGHRILSVSFAVAKRSELVYEGSEQLGWGLREAS